MSKADDRQKEEERLRLEAEERDRQEQETQAAARRGAPGSELTEEGQEAAARNRAARELDSKSRASEATNAEEEARKKAEAEKEASYITVRSGLKPVPATPGTPVGHRTALYEKDPAHPDGEAFVAGPTPVRVGPTPMVIAAIREGKLVEVDE